MRIPLLFSAVSLGLAVAPTLWADDQTALQDSNALLQDLQRYEARLGELETSLGPFDPRLQEPLLSMQRLHAQLGNFARVLEIQTRRLQLLRTSRGLQHPDIIPLLEAIVSTEIQLGNWAQVSDHLNHLRTLAQANAGHQSLQVMAAMERQAAWYLARVSLDQGRQRVSHYMESRELYDDLLELAEQIHGENTAPLIPWLYKRAYSLYQLVALLNSDGSLRARVIDETVRRDGVVRLQSMRTRGFGSFALHPFQRIPVTEADEPVGSAYLRLATGYLADMADIAEAEGDGETWAMTRIYRGDFALLAGKGSSRRHYRDGLEKLRQLGYSQQQLDAVFHRPMPIPVPVFFSRFDELEAWQLASSGTLQRHPQEEGGLDLERPWQQPVHAGIFQGWDRSIPEIGRPVLTDPLLQLDWPCQQVDLQFRVSSRGTVSSVEVLQSEPDQTTARRTAVRGVRNLRFRPAWYDDRPRARPRVQLRYCMLAEEDR